MMTQNADKKREQVQFLCMDDMVPQDHLLRIIDKAIDWNFIYDLVVEKYSRDNGRPSMDPVMLIKIPFIQYLYGIKSMRQTCKEIEVNVAYRWFLGLDMMDKVPHFSTFGKNYTRRFKDTDLFEQIFSHILMECYKYKLVDPTEVFVDATHVKARANNKKMQKRIAHEEALFYEELLKKEINEDREAHGKKPLKEKDDKDDDDNDNTPSAGGDPKEFTDDIPKDTKTIKCSTTDPESGWFRKGEHKNVFAYAIETACDKNGWILGYTINPGNQHDSRTFKGLYDKIKDIGIETLVADAGYKTPAIAKLLIDDGIKPLLPYKRPMTKDGFFKKYEYVYDEYYDCYICPNNQVLTYRTTNRDGNESRAYVCVYELEKVSKDKGKMGIAGDEKTAQKYNFGCNSFDKRNMALGFISQSRFVYSLTWPAVVKPCYYSVSVSVSVSSSCSVALKEHTMFCAIGAKSLSSSGAPRVTL